MKIRFLILTLALCAVTGIATASTVVVSPGNLHGWQFYSTDSSGVINTGSNTGGLVSGPATPPLGSGSAHFMTAAGAGDGSEQLRGGSSFDGTLLSDLTALTYSTYAASYGGDQLPYLQIYVNYTGGSTVDDRIIFEPVYSDSTFGGSQPAPALDTWQTFDALNGQWYTASGDPGSNGPGSNTITWGDFLTAYPNAVIVDSAAGVGGIRFTSGFSSTSDNYDTNIDAFTIGVNGTNTTYDFEAVPEPSVGCLLAIGIIGIVAMRWRKARSA
jgi:PEP-CTERM motif